MQNQANKRKSRFQAIRQSLKQNPVVKTKTMVVQNKLQKRRKRRESVTLNDDLTQQRINQILLQQQDIEVRTMTKFYQKYTMGQKIGEGSNGLVKKCYLKSTNQLFAVKSMKMDEEHILFIKRNFKDVIALDHPNIIKYRSMYLDQKNDICYLVMDYVTTPNLQQFKNKLEPEQVKIITQQLLSTVSYIHSNNICHRDIKPDNILYDRENRKITLIDFGISKNIQKRGQKKQMLTITGTLFYRAPQMFTGGGYDQKVDIWAVGVTLYELVTGKTPFQSQFLANTIQNIEKGQIEFDNEVWQRFGKPAKDLVIRLLKKRQQRLTADQAKKHFWFTKRTSNQSINGSNQLAKSDSLNIKLGQFLTASAFIQKCTGQNDKIFSHKKIPNIQKDLKKAFMGQSQDSDNSLIQIQSQGQEEGDSPFNPKIRKMDLVDSVVLRNSTSSKQSPSLVSNFQLKLTLTITTQNNEIKQIA